MLFRDRIVEKKSKQFFPRASARVLGVAAGLYYHIIDRGILMLVLCDANFTKASKFFPLHYVFERTNLMMCRTEESRDATSFLHQWFNPYLLQKNE